MGFDGGGLWKSFDVNSGPLGVGFLWSLILDFYFYLVLLLLVGGGCYSGMSGGVLVIGFLWGGWFWVVVFLLLPLMWNYG